MKQTLIIKLAKMLIKNVNNSVRNSRNVRDRPPTPSEKYRTVSYNICKITCKTADIHAPLLGKYLRSFN